MAGDRPRGGRSAAPTSPARARASAARGPERLTPRVPRKPRRPAWLRIVAAVAVAFALVLVATGVVRASYAGKALPHTSVAGVKVGGLSEDAIRTQLVTVAGRERSVVLAGAGQTITLKASETGFEPNINATIKAALDSGRSTFFSPLVALAVPRSAPLVATIDSARLDATVDVVAKTIDRAPYAGGLSIDPQTRVVTPRTPKDGRAVNQRELTRTLRKALLSGRTERIAVPIRTTNAVSEATVDDVASDAERYLAKPLTLSGAGKPFVVSAGSLATLLALEPLDGGAGARLGVDSAALGRLTARVAAARDRKAQDPQIRAPARGTTVDGKGAVSWKPVRASVTVQRGGRSGLAVQITEFNARVRRAVREGAHRAKVPVKTTATSVSDRAAKQINHLIGTFTTAYVAGQPRVTNIQRMAKTVDGTVIAPGAQFSLNRITGERTKAKGYVEAPFIADNKIEPSIGGGVSQFSTTMYNAAYFAGLRLDAYRTHSLYIDRYPTGRESTLNFPDIDLKWTNDTKVPILIRTQADDAGVTVTLYGDNTGRQVTASPGPRQPNPGGNFMITVTRTIKYPDGSTVRQPITTRYANELTEPEPQE